MNSLGLESIRYNGRYYVRRYIYNGPLQVVGSIIIGGIPADPRRYQEWLLEMRRHYDEKERRIEARYLVIPEPGMDVDSDDEETDIESDPDDDASSDVQMGDVADDDDSETEGGYAGQQVEMEVMGFDEVPSPFPFRELLIDSWSRITIDLDREILTINDAIHWKLDNIPRPELLWFDAMADSIYLNKPTIRLDMDLDEHIATPAIALPAPDNNVAYPFRKLTAGTNVDGQPRTGFLVRSLAGLMVRYRGDITRYGLEWAADSFPFRELVFALMSIAADEATYYCWRDRSCSPFCCCRRPNCKEPHTSAQRAWLTSKIVPEMAPLPKFGVPCHKAGEQPGASPAETIYFVQGVLVSLVLVVDNKAMSDAAKWGMEQGHTHFQIVVTSLFDMAFGEMTTAPDGSPLLKLTDPLPISPLRREYCLSTHPRNRPVLPDRETQQHSPDEIIFQKDATRSPRKLEKYFPALAALVNFFDTAARRRVAGHRNTSILPMEVRCRILDHTDDETWKTCHEVSEEFLDYCHRRYRIDNRTLIMTGPSVRMRRDRRSLSFVFKDEPSEKDYTLAAVPEHRPVATWSSDWNYMPVIGRDRKVIINSPLLFRHIPNGIEVDSDEDED